MKSYIEDEQSFKPFECIECDAWIDDEDCEKCPNCNASLDYTFVDEREDFARGT